MSEARTLSHAPRYLPCHLGAVRLAFDVEHLSGIRRSDRVQRNPSAQGPSGWVLDEREVPVLDLGTWLGLESRFGNGNHATPSRVLVFESGTEPRGILVDESGRARDVRGGDLYPLPAVLGDLSPLGLCGIWVSEDQPWLVLDPAVLSPESALGPALDIEAMPQDSASGMAARAGSSNGGSPEISETASDSLQGSGQGRMLLFSTDQGERLERPVRFGLSIRQILEVATLPELGQVPGAPSFVHGLTLWRGEPLVVIDLDRRLGWGADEAPDRLLIARASDGTRIGLVTRGNFRLLRLPVAHRPSELTIDHDLVLGIFELQDETVILPNLNQLVVAQGP